MLDSSALLALLSGEPGAEIVEARLGTAVISSVNLSETLTKLVQHGAAPERASHSAWLAVVHHIRPVIGGELFR